MILEIRTAGLIAGIEFKDTNTALEIYDLGIKLGLITRKSIDGKGPSLVIKPPLITTQKEIIQAMKILDKCLHLVSKNK